MKTKQQANSEVWERYIRGECARMARAQLAFVDKNWEAPRVPGKKIPREKSKPDFSGYLPPTGRHVVFEAKSTESLTSFAASLLTDHQDEHLRTAYENGAISFVYVIDGHRRIWVIPWHMLRLGGRSSFSFSGEHAIFYEKNQPKQETWLDTLCRVGLLTDAEERHIGTYRAKYPLKGDT